MQRVDRNETLFHFRVKEIEVRTLSTKGIFIHTCFDCRCLREIAFHFISVSYVHKGVGLDNISNSCAFFPACASVLQIPSVPVIRSLKPGKLKSCLVRCHHLRAPQGSSSQRSCVTQLQRQFLKVTWKAPRIIKLKM